MQIIRITQTCEFDKLIVSHCFKLQLQIDKKRNNISSGEIFS